MSNDHSQIIVIDNSPDIVSFLCKEFTDEGYECFTATTPNDARMTFLALYNKPEYKSPIFLIDVRLDAHETGWDVVKYIRRYDKDAIIAMFTGRHNTVVDKLQLKKYDANLMIYKPKIGAEILAEIKKYQTKARGFGELANGQSGMLTLSPKESIFAFMLLLLIAVYLVDVTYRSSQIGQIAKVQADIVSHQVLEDMLIQDTRDILLVNGIVKKKGESK